MPGSPTDRLSDAIALHESGRFAEAEQSYKAILARAPRDAEALHLLGLLRISTDRFDSGVDLIRKAIALRADAALFHANLGLAFLRSGRYADATVPLRRAVELEPGRSDGHDQLAAALALSGDEGAIEVLRRAALRFPRDARFHIRLSAMLLERKDPAGARSAAERALSLVPGHPDALTNLGLAAAAAKDYAAALRCFDAALNAAPMHPSAQNNLAHAAGLLGDFPRQERAAALITRRIGAGAPGDSWATLADVAYGGPYLGLPAEIQRRTLLLLGERFPATAPLPARPISSFGPAGARPLRIGYVSTGFGNHPIGHVTRTLFSAHDRARFRIYGYPLLDRSADDGDYLGSIRAGCDEWRDLSRMDDAAAAAAIHADEIDILVDLNGFLEWRRPAVFAHRPAPVQVFWLAHAGGLGLPFIDYLIADGVVVPPGEEQHYRESLVRLPEIYHCADAPPISEEPLSAEAEGLGGAQFVFCAFNNPQKIDRRTFASWMRILAAVPESYLWLSDQGGGPVLQANLRRGAEESGVAGKRIVFAGRVRSKSLHLARHRLAGLFLDTSTVNAATTALDALWAGLPVLTCRGDHFASRMAQSMLRALGLDDALVAEDLAEYEGRAIALARDQAALAALRVRLQDAVASRPLFDTRRFCRYLERAFEGMWRRHASGLPPVSFDVEPV